MGLKRSRAENRVAHTAAVHEISVSEMERVFLAHILGQIDGLGKDDARKVGRIIDEFALEEFTGIDTKDRNTEYTYSLSGYEINYLIDQIDAIFEAKKVLPAHAKAAIRLYDRLKATLEPKEADEEA